MTKTLLLFFTVIFAINTYSQSIPKTVYGSKLDLRTLEGYKKGNVGEGVIHLLVKGDLERVKAVTEKFGGTYKYGFGNIASVMIPKKNLIAFSEDGAIRKIQSPMAKGMALMDSARIRNNIDSAYAGIAPLADSLTGKNVIVGIIDGGLYWRHRDFQNPDGTTRVMYIWDQGLAGSNAPLPFDYGTEWSSVDLNAGNCTEIDPAGDFGHGTTVTGIAAGNCLSLQGTPYQGTLRGVAPESNIIFVNVADNTNFETGISDGVDYIFQKADALGMPCVINISQGTYYGSHDGIDMTSEIIDTLLNQLNGRVVVAAAGNAGNIRMHLSYPIPVDSNNPGFTFFNYNVDDEVVYFDLWTDTANFSSTWFTIGCNDTLGNDYGHLPYINIPQQYSVVLDSDIITDQPLYMGDMLGGTYLGEVVIGVELEDGGRYHIQFQVSPGLTSYLWRLQMYGGGTFDVWSTSNGVLGTSDIIDSISTGDSSNPHIFIQYPNYYHPDTLETMCTSFQCSNEVITVGNYSNRAGYLDYDTDYVDLTLPQNGGEVVGKIFATSSLGPTRDGRLKPDIVATGSTTITTGDSLFISQAIGAGNQIKVYVTGVDQRNGGTSMASPLVAGIAALYLQKRPTATYNEIKLALTCTAVSDSFTGTTPNYTYGNGKVNAFQALTNSTCIIYGSMDTACYNYNPLANVDTGYCVAKIYGNSDTSCVNYTPNTNIDTGGCIAKVYGCKDTNALNYDSLANEPGPCLYPSSIKNITGQDISLQVMPNPFSNQTVFSLVNNGYNYTKGEIQIINQLGEVVDAFSIGNVTGNYPYLNNKLSAGFYYYRLKADDKIVKTGKLVVD